MDAVVGVVLGLVVVDEFAGDACGVDPHPTMAMAISPLTSSSPTKANRLRPCAAPCTQANRDSRAIGTRRQFSGDDAHKRSMMVPVASAPPQHMLTSASEASRRSSSCSAVVMRRLPVEPTGWPSAIAPPFTFTLSGSAPWTFAHEQTTDAKASFTSKMSMSYIFIPAFSSTAAVAAIGPSRW